MLFQNSIQILYDIIGSAITIGTAILVWFCIEKLKKFLKNQILHKNFQKLFRIFSRERLEFYMGIEIADLIDEIGTKYLLKILKLYKTNFEHGIKLIGDTFQIIIEYLGVRNSLRLYQGNTVFFYSESGANLIVKKQFLKYFEEQCKNEKIKLRVKSKF
ncbi:hypothetical protein ES703_119332 [subsurface metagenome]